MRVETPMDPRFESVIAALTYNALVTLQQAHRYRDPRFPGAICGSRRVYTGTGKWTSIAALGVLNCLAKHKLVNPSDGYMMTPLGIDVAAYLATDSNRELPCWQLARARGRRDRTSA